MADERVPEPPRRLDEQRKPEDYRAARIGVAAGLTFVLGFLLILDAFSPDYSISEVTLTALLATILTLLGAEALSILGKRR